MRHRLPAIAGPLKLLPAIACVATLAGCGYIVTPEAEGTPTPAVTAGWAGLATKVEAADGGLHVDLTIRNDTGAWSAMQASGQPATLTTSDGKTTNCATVVVGTGGTTIPPGFQVRGYTGGTKAKPETQLLSVDCAGASPSAGAKLSIPYAYVTGDFNYYAPAAPTDGKLEVDLGSVASDLTYPVAATIDGVIEKADAKIDAINHTTLSLTSAKRTGDGLELAWQADNPTEYPTYVHIGTPPVVGLRRRHLRSLREPPSRRHPDHPGRRVGDVDDDGRCTQGRNRTLCAPDRREQAAEDLHRSCHRHHGQVTRARADARAARR